MGIESFNNVSANFDQKLKYASSDNKIYKNELNELKDLAVTDDDKKIVELLSQDDNTNVDFSVKTGKAETTYSLEIDEDLEPLGKMIANDFKEGVIETGKGIAKFLKDPIGTIKEDIQEQKELREKLKNEPKPTPKEVLKEIGEMHKEAFQTLKGAIKSQNQEIKEGIQELKEKHQERKAERAEKRAGQIRSVYSGTWRKNQEADDRLW